MPRIGLLLLIMPIMAATATVACKKTGTGPTTVATQTATDGAAMIEVGFAYEAKGDRELELFISMRAIGVEQMDKIVVQVEIGEFHVVDGAARWTGFVPPRDPQRHRVLLRAVDGVESPTLTVNVSRSRDSSPLVSETLQFEVDGGRIVAR